MYSSLGSHLKLNFVELLGLEHQWASQTCYCSTSTSGVSATSVSTGNVLGVSFMIPEIDFPRIRIV